MLNLEINNDIILTFRRLIHVRRAFPRRNRRIPYVNKNLKLKAKPLTQSSHILIPLHDRKLYVIIKQIKLLKTSHSRIY